MRKIVLIISNVPYDFSSNTLINLVQSIASSDLSIQVQDFTGLEPPEPNGYRFAEEIPEGSKIFKVFAALPNTASQFELSQTLTAIQKGKLSANPNIKPKAGSENIKIPNNLKIEDYLINLGFDAKGEYTGLLPIFNVAGAPQWLTNLLNTITGHGMLSLFFWIGVTTILSLKISQDKKKSKLLIFLLGFSILMTIDSYRIRNSKK